MNSSDRSALHRARRPAHPMGYVLRRLSSLAILGGAIAAIVSAGLLESAGSPEPVAVGAGLVVLIAASWLAAGLDVGRLNILRGEGPL